MGGLSASEAQDQLIPSFQPGAPPKGSTTSFLNVMLAHGETHNGLIPHPQNAIRAVEELMPGLDMPGTHTR